ncbi:hypothetical lipoprotein [Clostridium sp. CAG:510]|nr:hypothetical lipoprotein [Clostridium sp. CAG:510]
MEKLHLENKIEISKIIRNRKATKVALIVILVFTLAMATGCGKKKNKNTEPTTPSTTVTKEETTPEVVEPTESTPVETVEPTETVSETEDIESIDLSQYSNAVDCINALQSYDDLLIIVWNSENGGGQTILKNGDHYKNSASSSFFFNRTPENDNIKDATLECKDNNAELRKTKKNYGFITVTGEDVEYKATFIYKDGTEETITVYITEE